MVVWSTSNLSQLPAFRLDAEYYHPDYIRMHNTLMRSNAVPIADFAYVTDGIHASPDWVENDGIRYLSAMCVKDNEILPDAAGMISKQQNVSNPRTQARLNDVLLTSVGTIGNAAVVDEEVLPANMDRHLGIIRINNYDEVDPYYLSTFLNCKYGQFQTLREATGNVQLNLFIAKIKRILVPIGKEFNDIGDSVRQAYTLRKSAQSALESASDFWVQRFGLDINLRNELSYKSKFSDILTNLDFRFDPEYFQPKYRQIKEIIQSLNPIEIVPLGSLLDTLTNGHTPRYHDLSIGDVTFLTAEHVHDFRIDYSSHKRILMSDHTNLLGRTRLHSGDMLMTIKGKIGNVALVKDVENPININQDVALLRFKKGINPYYVMGYLNSKIGKTLIEQASTGQINPFLRLGTIRELLVPIFDPAIMDELGNSIEKIVIEGYQKEIEFQLLMAQAKYQIETIIQRGYH